MTLFSQVKNKIQEIIVFFTFFIMTFFHLLVQLSWAKHELLISAMQIAMIVEILLLHVF
jgi:hypothetical protein